MKLLETWLRANLISRKQSSPRVHSTSVCALLSDNNFTIHHPPRSDHELVVLHDLSLALSAHLSMSPCLLLLSSKNLHGFGLKRCLLIVNQIIVDLPLVSHVDSSCRRLRHQSLPVLCGLIFESFSY